jgi:hypothetical protein
MKHCLFLAGIGVLAFSGPAQSGANPAQCPVPVMPGKYYQAQTNAMSIMKFYTSKGNFQMPVVPQNTGKPATIVVDDPCQNSFRITGRSAEGIAMNWEMGLKSWGNSHGPEYSGSFSARGVTFDIEAFVPDPRTVAAQTTITIRAAGNMAQMAPFSIGKLNQGPRTRYECGCRPKLEKWIAEKTAEAERLRDLFKNPAYRKRPKALPPDGHGPGSRWKPTVYKDVIYTMAGHGVSFEEAAEAVAWAYWPQEMQKAAASNATSGGAGAAATSGGTGSAGSAGTNTEQVAYTDFASCDAHFGDLHQQDCYPALSLEATQLHENVHVANCKAARAQLQDVPDLNKQADGEVEAYSKEMDFLQSWIPNNCG